jgi:hypothetical protein
MKQNLDIHSALLLRPSCVPEKVGVNKNDILKKQLNKCKQTCQKGV